MNENKVISGTGLLGRFLGAKVSLCDVYKKDKDDLNKYESILDDLLERTGHTAIPDHWITKSNPRDLKFVTESGIDVAIGASASSLGGSGKINLSFSRKNTGFVYLKNAIIEELSLGEIRKEVIDIWDKKEYEKQSRRFVLVNKLIRAESGTIIFSKSRKNEIGIEAKTQDIPLVDIEPAIDGKIAIASSKSEYLEVISEHEFEPLFGAVRLNKKERFKAVD